jgi:tetratricopeptide (TPR) repeat protein
LDEALAKSERSVELDPYNVRTQSFRAQGLLGARRYDETIAVARQALKAEPNNLVAQTALLGALFMKGRFSELMDLERARWAGDRELLEALEKGHLEAGYPGAVKRLADVLAARHGKPGGRRAIIVANSYARAGDIERVIEWLEKAYEEHDNNMPYIGGNPHFDLVHSDPRFQDLVRRMKLPPGDEK